MNKRERDEAKRDEAQRDHVQHPAVVQPEKNPWGQAEKDAAKARIAVLQAELERRPVTLTSADRQRKDIEINQLKTRLNSNE